MALTSEEGFGIGTEVELTAPSSSYILNERNPVKGGTHFCTGNIYRILNAGSVSVRWENGTTNQYRIQELSYAKKTQMYNSIW